MAEAYEFIGRQQGNNDLSHGKQERTENYDLEGTFNDKIWGSSPDEEYFKIYFIFK